MVAVDIFHQDFISRKQFPSKHRNILTVPSSHLIMLLLLTCSNWKYAISEYNFLGHVAYYFQALGINHFLQQRWKQISCDLSKCKCKQMPFHATKYTNLCIWRISRRTGPEAECLKNCCCGNSGTCTQAADRKLQYNLHLQPIWPIDSTVLV